MKLTVSYYKTEMLDIEKLQPFQGNLKDLSEANYKKLRKQILDNGFAEPFSVWENEGNVYILNGHQRHREIVKMKEEGINVPALPCNFIRCANRKEAKKMILALTSQYGNMTEDGLYEFLEESGIGFEEMRDCYNFPEINMDDFGAGYYGDDDKGNDDGFEMPDHESIETDIKLGDLFEIGRHRLLCGDSTDSDQVARLMNGEKADMVFTDPPYGIDWNTDYTRFKGGLIPSKNKYSKIQNDEKEFDPAFLLGMYDKCLLFGANCFSDKLPKGNWIVWDKRFKNGKAFLADAEVAWYNGSGAVYIIAETHQGYVSSDDKRHHPTQKPVKLIQKVFEKIKAPNFLFDPFLGSGSTMVAAHQSNRKCYGMELDPCYCQVIIDRMLKLDNTLEIKKNGEIYQRESMAS